ncbi:uncharacterized protein [Physcomitrium patens]|uniref:AP2/ERF domain-containing protein n=1 Tax=Physcomitrium patens TaxID=3218 RepID=A0A2K1ILX0_PHYPA|nr:AP2/ERF and B3 domain-containing protein Os05g0549800-like [Physcomitrium patens]PNR30266.1 hypothetical protein PHYPA_026582 [Physcomitrium patens]|eukprot:XP_024360275.1 AP2/ERF and B3 domain-containing protein Os05g0549800-like [Physcomitrella patens]
MTVSGRTLQAERGRGEVVITVAKSKVSGVVNSANIGISSNFPSAHWEAIATKTIQRIGMQLGSGGDDKLSPTSGHIEKPARKPGKRWKKGAMKGKGGPENAACEFRGVRQRTWGKWVAEIREPKKRARLWLGSFSTAREAALAYDIAARKLYGSMAELNLPPSESAGIDSVPSSTPTKESSSPPRVMHDVEITEHLELPRQHSLGTSASAGSSSRTSMHIGIREDHFDVELVMADSGRAFGASDARQVFPHEMVRDSRGMGEAGPSLEMGTDSSSSSQVNPPHELFSITPEFQQHRYYNLQGSRLGTSLSGEYLKDIESFLNRMDDDDDYALGSNSSLSQSTESAGGSYPPDPHWDDENLGTQFLNSELESLDSVLNEPLVPENVELWDTRDTLPPSDPSTWQ